MKISSNQSVPHTLISFLPPTPRLRLIANLRINLRHLLHLPAPFPVRTRADQEAVRPASPDDGRSLSLSPTEGRTDIPLQTPPPPPPHRRAFKHHNADLSFRPRVPPLPNFHLLPLALFFAQKARPPQANPLNRCSKHPDPRPADARSLAAIRLRATLESTPGVSAWAAHIRLWSFCGRQTQPRARSLHALPVLTGLAPACGVAWLLYNGKGNAQGHRRSKRFRRSYANAEEIKNQTKSYSTGELLTPYRTPATQMVPQIYVGAEDPALAGARQVRPHLRGLLPA
ncbi:hypothetical protein C8R44DRAFT_990823 [Mycena epipterygia]|nr:hypothetical protein C8R44DRAFT_990823 [Mycena epipterygia]